MIEGKTIFIAPLDWGLGHATRCVPLIRTLEEKNKIIIGVTPLVKPVFDEEFPHIQQVDLPSYDVKYSTWIPLWMKIAAAWPGMSETIKREHVYVNAVIHAHNVDVVISDNRFGLFTKYAHTIFITHQVFLKTPFAAGLAQQKNRHYISNFDEVWIPDYEQEERSLSGALSHGEHFHPHVRYIGPLTRLKKSNAPVKKYDHLFLLSGPEPQQTLLKNLLVEKVSDYPDRKFAMVSNAKPEREHSNLDVFVFPSSQQLSERIAESKTIVCRSGYSTLMDLHLLGKKELILIPTPGQTEQEYLASYWEKKSGAISLEQKQVQRYKF